MRAFVIPKGNSAVDGLKPADLPMPEPGPGEVLVRLRAVSLNYRDHAVLIGTYHSGPVDHDLVPASDGAGEVVALGKGVTGFKVGDRVTNLFAQIPPGAPADAAPVPLGVPLEGVLAEYRTFRADGLLHLPDAIGYAEGACLPCAGCTAWNALFEAGGPILPGETVLVLGTGGVSMIALQLARAAGARVIVTSSSDAKIARARALGASDGVNYRSHPDWDQEVLRLTDGKGADRIIESGGPGTLQRSYGAVALYGHIALLGVLTGKADSNPLPLMFRRASVHGIHVGGRAMFEKLIRAVVVNRIEPLIGARFAFEEARAAFACQAAGEFIGKIVIEF